MKPIVQTAGIEISRKSLLHKDLGRKRPGFCVVSLVLTRVYVIFLILLSVHWVGQKNLFNVSLYGIRT